MTEIMNFTKKKDKDDYRWLTRALSKNNDDTRTHTKNLYADEKNLVCTDGSRLHMMKNNGGITPGHWKLIKADSKEVILQRQETDDSYPDYNIVFESEVDTEIPATRDYIKILTLIIRSLPDGLTINPDLLKTTTNGILWDTIYTTSEGSGPVIFENGAKRAAVMPRMM